MKTMKTPTTVALQFCETVRLAKLNAENCLIQITFRQVSLIKCVLKFSKEILTSTAHLYKVYTNTHLISRPT